MTGYPEGAGAGGVNGSNQAVRADSDMPMLCAFLEQRDKGREVFCAREDFFSSTTAIQPGVVELYAQWTAHGEGWYHVKLDGSYGAPFFHGQTHLAQELLTEVSRLAEGLRDVPHGVAKRL